MFKRALLAVLSAVTILLPILTFTAYGSSHAMAQKTDTSSTQQDVDDPRPPSSSSTANKQRCTPTEGDCASFVATAVDEQWDIAASDVLNALNKCKAFTAEDRKKLTASEAGLSGRQRFRLRLNALTQLAQR